MSLQELCRQFYVEKLSLEATLVEMKNGSCSVNIGWSEDNREHWECSWIVGGQRYTGLQRDIRAAVGQAISLCFERCVGNVVSGKEAG